MMADVAVHAGLFTAGLLVGLVVVYVVEFVRAWKRQTGTVESEGERVCGDRMGGFFCATPEGHPGVHESCGGRVWDG